MPMSLRSFLLLVSLSAVAFTARAEERPKIPTPGYDLKLTGGIAIKDFFAERLKDQNCQKDLARAKASYEASRNQLQELLKQNASSEELDSAEAAMDKNRLTYLNKVKACGPCAVQPLEKRTVITTQKEVWYITDGSCSLANIVNPNQFDTYFEKASSFLKDMKHYPRREGGFFNVLDFQAVDMKSGELSAPTEKLESSPYFTFVAVKGPAPFGLLNTAFSYVFRNDVTEKKSGDLKEYIIRFEAVPPPEGFVTPDITITSAGGTHSGTIAKELKLVQGMWYVNNQGYFRYYTAADFGMKVPFADAFAINTLLDTVLQLSERSAQ